MLKGRIELARVLTAKDRVLDGFGEHLRFLDGKRLSVGGFHAAVEQARLELGVPAACVTSRAV